MAEVTPVIQIALVEKPIVSETSYTATGLQGEWNTHLL